jgi:hypothetical protein
MVNRRMGGGGGGVYSEDEEFSNEDAEIMLEKECNDDFMEHDLMNANV